MTKDDLKNYEFLRREVIRLRERLEEIDSRISSPKIPVINGMPHAPLQSSTSAQEDMLIKAMELRELYYTKLQEMQKRLYEVEMSISDLEPISRVLLRYRYLDGKTWEEICEKLDYSWAQVHRLHTKALEQLKD